MVDYTHLNALEYRLHNEKMRLNEATNSKEIELRKVWVFQIEKEIKAERAFLNLPEMESDIEMTLDELLAELEL